MRKDMSLGWILCKNPDSWALETRNGKLTLPLGALHFQSGIQISPAAEPYKHLSLTSTNTLKRLIL